MPGIDKGLPKIRALVSGCWTARAGIVFRVEREVYARVVAS
jgi:hypothetical protein